MGIINVRTMLNSVFQWLLMVLGICFFHQSVFIKPVVAEERSQLQIKTGKINNQLLLTLSFPPFAPMDPAIQVNYEVLCTPIDPRTYDRFPYINNFIHLNPAKSTAAKVVGTVDFQRIAEPYRGFMLECHLHYRYFDAQGAHGGVMGTLKSLMVPLISQHLQKVDEGIFSVEFKYRFPEASTFRFFSIKCESRERIVQLDIEPNPAKPDENFYHVEFDFNSLRTQKEIPDIYQCHLIARFLNHTGYESEPIGFAGKIGAL